MRRRTAFDTIDPAYCTVPRWRWAYEAPLDAGAIQDRPPVTRVLDQGMSKKRQPETRVRYRRMKSVAAAGGPAREHAQHCPSRDAEDLDGHRLARCESSVPKAIASAQGVQVCRLSTIARTHRRPLTSADAPAWNDADTADLFTGTSRGVDESLWMVDAHVQDAPLDQAGRGGVSVAGRLTIVRL